MADEVGDELRKLFADERLDIAPKIGAENAVIAGARRRRKHRTVAVTGGGAFAVALLALGGFAIGGVFGPTGEKTQPTSGQTLGVGQSQDSLPPAPPSATPTSLPPATTVLPPASEPPASPQQTPAPTVNQPPKRSPVYSGVLIGPDGYGSLRLGMTAKAAGDAGVTMRQLETAGSCGKYNVTGAVPASGSAATGSDGGVVTISPAAAAHTPEGIGKGSTSADVRDVYPAAKASGSKITAPAGAGSVYAFTLDAAENVVSVALTSPGAACGS